MRCKASSRTIPTFRVSTDYFKGCTGFDYFKSDGSIWPDLGTQIRPDPDPDLGRTCLESQNNTPDETNDVDDVNNAVNCYAEEVQFSASFVMSLFSSF